MVVFTLDIQDVSHIVKLLFHLFNFLVIYFYLKTFV